MEFDINKRNFHRYSCNYKIEYDEMFNGTVSNISYGGLQFETQKSLEKDRKLRFKLIFNELDSIYPLGRISYVKDSEKGFSIGVEFFDLSYRDKLILQAKLKQLALETKYNLESSVEMDSIAYRLKETASLLNDVDMLIEEAENNFITNSQNSVNQTEIKEYQIEAENQEPIVITISEDAMRAYADFYPEMGEKQLSKNEIHEILDLNNIKLGIKWDAIEQAIDEVKSSSCIKDNVLIAEGTDPVEEIPEYIIISSKFKDKSESTFKNNENIDYRDISPYRIVVENEEIARIQELQPGKNGLNVKGEILEFSKKDVPDIQIGKNLQIINNSVRALCNGNLHIESDRIFINKILRINGDVDYNTGNIKFLGDIFIEGGIREGFKVICGGSLFCKKTIEVTDIFVQQDLIAEKGIIGRKNPQLRVGGNIIAKFIENCKVDCKKSIFTDRGIVNSTINTLDQILTGPFGRIQNCNLMVQNGVTCHQIGTPGSKVTKINLGVDFVINRRIEIIKEKNDKISQTIENIETFISSNENNKLKIQSKLHKALNNLENLLTHLLPLLHKNENAKLKVNGKIYPFLEISICHITDQITHEGDRKMFSLDKKQGKIVQEPIMN